MKKIKLVSFAIILIAIFSTSSVHAHHSFAAEFDANRPLELVGTVTRMVFRLETEPIGLLVRISNCLMVPNCLLVLLSLVHRKNKV